MNWYWREMFSDQDVMSCCEYLDGLFPEIPVFDTNRHKEVGIKEEDDYSRMEEPREIYLYVLALKEGKYYVGASDVPKERIMSHFTGGSAWTRKYEPSSVVEVIRGDVFDEDKITKKYMHSHGIDNVRGGSYIQMCLSEEQRVSLEKEFITIDSRCFHCHQKGHFVSKCPTKQKKEKNEEVKHRWLPCQRCGFPSHTEKQCYAKFDVDGYSIDPSSDDEDCLEEEEEEEEEAEEEDEHTSSLSESH